MSNVGVVEDTWLVVRLVYQWVMKTNQRDSLCWFGFYVFLEKYHPHWACNFMERVPQWWIQRNKYDYYHSVATRMAENHIFGKIHRLKEFRPLVLEYKNQVIQETGGLEDIGDPF